MCIHTHGYIYIYIYICVYVFALTSSDNACRCLPLCNVRSRLESSRVQSRVRDREKERSIRPRMLNINTWFCFGRVAPTRSQMNDCIGLWHSETKNLFTLELLGYMGVQTLSGVVKVFKPDTDEDMYFR